MPVGLSAKRKKSREDSCVRVAAGHTPPEARRQLALRPNLRVAIGPCAAIAVQNMRQIFSGVRTRQVGDSLRRPRAH